MLASIAEDWPDPDHLDLPNFVRSHCGHLAASLIACSPEGSDTEPLALDSDSEH